MKRLAGHLDWPGFAGDLLRSHDGQWVAVESACNSGEMTPVYNMRVEEYHTYFVGDTHWGFSVWAHNANYRVPGGGGTPQEVAGQRGSELVKQFKKSGVGQQAGRSGGHGEPFKKAGTALIREANQLPKSDPLREALKKQGLRLIEKGKGISHPGGGI